MVDRPLGPQAVPVDHLPPDAQRRRRLLRSAINTAGALPRRRQIPSPPSGRRSELPPAASGRLRSLIKHRPTSLSSSPIQRRRPSFARRPPSSASPPVGCLLSDARDFFQASTARCIAASPSLLPWPPADTSPPPAVPCPLFSSFIILRLSTPPTGCRRCLSVPSATLHCPSHRPPEYSHRQSFLCHLLPFSPASLLPLALATDEHCPPLFLSSHRSHPAIRSPSIFITPGRRPNACAIDHRCPPSLLCQHRPLPTPPLPRSHDYPVSKLELKKDSEDYFYMDWACSNRSKPLISCKPGSNH